MKLSGFNVTNFVVCGIIIVAISTTIIYFAPQLAPIQYQINIGLGVLIGLFLFITKYVPDMALLDIIAAVIASIPVGLGSTAAMKGIGLIEVIK